MGIGGFGIWEMVFVFLVVLLLFGAKRLPEIGSSLGKGIREFRSSMRDIEHEIKKPDETSTRAVPPPAEENRTPRRLGEGSGNGDGSAS